MSTQPEPKTARSNKGASKKPTTAKTEALKLRSQPKPSKRWWYFFAEIRRGKDFDVNRFALALIENRESLRGLMGLKTEYSVDAADAIDELSTAEELLKNYDKKSLSPPNPGNAYLIGMTCREQVEWADGLLFVYAAERYKEFIEILGELDEDFRRLNRQAIAYLICTVHRATKSLKLRELTSPFAVSDFPHDEDEYEQRDDARYIWASIVTPEFVKQSLYAFIRWRKRNKENQTDRFLKIAISIAANRDFNQIERSFLMQDVILLWLADGQKSIHLQLRDSIDFILPSEIAMRLHGRSDFGSSSRQVRIMLRDLIETLNLNEWEQPVSIDEVDLRDQVSYAEVLKRHLNALNAKFEP